MGAPLVFGHVPFALPQDISPLVLCSQTISGKAGIMIRGLVVLRVLDRRHFSA